MIASHVLHERLIKAWPIELAWTLFCLNNARPAWQSNLTRGVKLIKVKKSSLFSFTHLNSYGQGITGSLVTIVARHISTVEVLKILCLNLNATQQTQDHQKTQRQREQRGRHLVFCLLVDVGVQCHDISIWESRSTCGNSVSASLISCLFWFWSTLDSQQRDTQIAIVISGVGNVTKTHQNRIKM